MPTHHAEKHAFASCLLLSFGLALTPTKSDTNTTTATTNNSITITCATTITKPGCLRQCGNLTVPYPFGIGIGTGCSIDSWFDINCNTSFTPPKAFIGSIQVHCISDSQVRVSNAVAKKCYDRSGAVNHDNTAWTNLGTSPYTFSEANKFTVIGCDDFALILAPNSATSPAGAFPYARKLKTYWGSTDRISGVAKPQSRRV